MMLYYGANYLVVTPHRLGQGGQDGGSPWMLPKINWVFRTQATVHPSPSVPLSLRSWVVTTRCARLELSKPHVLAPATLPPTLSKHHSQPCAIVCQKLTMMQEKNKNNLPGRFNFQSTRSARCCQGASRRDTHDCLLAMARPITFHPKPPISRR